MIWSDIALVTVPWEVILSTPAAAKDCVEIKDLKEFLPFTQTKRSDPSHIKLMPPNSPVQTAKALLFPQKFEGA
jgi:hypothetical protein